MNRISFIALLFLSTFFATTIYQNPLRSDPAIVASLNQSDTRLLTIETQLAQMLNQERTRRQLPALVYDSRLADVARAHSAEMRDKKYFSHESPTSELQWPLDRYQNGLQQTPRLVAENIYRRWGGPRGLPADTAKQAHQSFMNSPGHKSKILLPSATRFGIGVQANAEGDIWVTEMFSRPK